MLAQIEPLRKDKQIGSSLQARVVIAAAPAELARLERYRDELPMLFIVSQVALERSAGDEDLLSIDVARAEGHKCARMHGHSYQVEVVIEGDIDPERGWVMDFADIDERVLPLVRQVDHQVLNEIDGLTNPTSELLAVWWWKRLAPVLPGLLEVVVSETPTSRCVYRGQ